MEVSYRKGSKLAQGSSKKVETPRDTVVAPTGCAMMIWVPSPHQKFSEIHGSGWDSAGQLVNKTIL